MDSCVFCQIVSREIAAKILYENDQVIAFNDINPSAKIHVLIIPKAHITTVLDIKHHHDKLLHGLFAAAQHLVKEKKMDKMKYRLVFNGGLAQHIDHVHLHLLGGDLVGVPE